MRSPTTDQLLRSLGPAVLVVEDAQWVDDDTVRLLDALAGRRASRLSVVLTCRDEEVAPGAPLRALLQARSDQITRVVLRPLSIQGVATLVGRHLGGGAVHAALAARLHERSAGIPFVVEEDVKRLRELGHLTNVNGVWRLADQRRGVAARSGRRRRPRPRRAPVRRRAEVRRRGSRRRRPSRRPPRRRGRRIRPRRGGSRRGRGVSSTLLRSQGRAVVFRHRLARDAVYEAIALPRRRHVHAAIGRALASEPRAADVAQMVHHCRLSGDHELWTEAADVAATVCHDAGDDESAYRHLAELLDSDAVSDGSRRADLTSRLFWMAPVGAPDSAERVRLLLERALAYPGLSRGVRGELRLYASWHGRGDVDLDAYAEVHAALSDLDDRPDLRACALASLAAPVRTDVTSAARAAYLEPAHAAAERSGNPTAVAYVDANVAWAAVAAGEPGGWAGLSRLLAPAASAGVDRQHLRALSNGVSAALDSGHFRRAIEIAAAAGRLAAGVGSTRYDAGLRRAVTLASWSIGDLGHAQAEAASRPDDPSNAAIPDLDMTALVRGEALLARGALEAAWDVLRPVAERQLAWGETGRAARATCSLLRIAATTGDDAPAVALTEEIFAVIATTELWVRAAALLPCAPPELLADVIDRYRDAVARCDSPLAAAALVFADGRQAEERGDRAAAADAYVRARYRFGKVPQPRLAALAAEAVGRVSGGAGAYRDAQRIYAGLGDSWEENRVKHAMRKTGVRTSHRAGRRGYGEMLSPREREVADLVVLGHSNPEIAERLFLSPRTVETHVSRILRKLDLGSRRELPTAPALQTR